MIVSQTKYPSPNISHDCSAFENESAFNKMKKISVHANVMKTDLGNGGASSSGGSTLDIDSDGTQTRGAAIGRATHE